MRIVVLSVALLAALSAAPVAQSPDARVRSLLESPQFKQAVAFIQSDQDRFVRELVTLTEIPSPPFKEQARAKAFLEMLRQQGLRDVEMDAEGNVMGVRKGTLASPKPTGEGGPVSPKPQAKADRCSRSMPTSIPSSRRART